jgi:hypothetical protein
MAKQKVTVYGVRRTNQSNPADNNLIFGAPGSMADADYPSNTTFLTTVKGQAKKYAKEMNGRWGRSENYVVEELTVKVPV